MSFVKYYFKKNQGFLAFPPSTFYLLGWGHTLL